MILTSNLLVLVRAIHLLLHSRGANKKDNTRESVAHQNKCRVYGKECQIVVVHVHGLTDTMQSN